MIGLDCVDNETSLGQRSTTFISRKPSDKPSNREIFPAREKENMTLNCHREDIDCKEMAWESEAHVVGPYQQNIMHSVTSPHRASKEKACAWVNPIVPQSNLKLHDYFHDSLQRGELSNLLNTVVSQSTISKTLPPLIQSQPHLDVPHQGCSTNRSKQFESISRIENGTTHQLEGVKGKNNANSMIKEINDMLHPASSVRKEASELAHSQNHTPFCWSSSKMIVFVNGKPMDMSVSVPKYRPKKRNSKKYKRRKLAMKLAAAANAVNSKLTTAKSVVESDMKFKEVKTYLIFKSKHASNSGRGKYQFASEYDATNVPPSHDVDIGLTTANGRGSSRSNSKSNKEKEKSTRTSRPSRSSAKATQQSEVGVSSIEDNIEVEAASVPVLRIVRRGGGRSDNRRMNTESSCLVSNTTQIEKEVRKHSHAKHRKVTLTKAENILEHRQEVALRFLKTASDYGSMQAALVVFRDLHNDIELHKDAMASIEQATVAIPYLMHSAMMKFLTISRKDGGPGLSEENARKLTMGLFKRMGPACCDENVNENDLVRIGGLLKKDAHRVLPHLLRVAKTVSDEYKQMLKELFPSENQQISSAKLWSPKRRKIGETI